MSAKYDDIISLPHYRSKTRPCMSVSQRAAQFSAFAALRGFDEEIGEAARYTEESAVLSEERRTELGTEIASLGKGQKITVTYFLPDAKKAGGAYFTKHGSLKKIDVIDGFLEFSDGVIIPFDDVSDIF